MEIAYFSSGLCSRKGSGQTKKQAAVTTTSAVPGATPLPGAGYKPGHLPVFIDTDEKAADTFYELKTKHLFPNKGEIVPKSVTGSKVGGGGGPAPAIDGPAKSAVQQQPNAPKSKSPR